MKPNSRIENQPPHALSELFGCGTTAGHGMGSSRMAPTAALVVVASTCTGTISTTSALAYVVARMELRCDDEEPGHLKAKDMQPDREAQQAGL